MNRVKLNDALFSAKMHVINALTEYVRKNGEKMSEYFYDEYGIEEEDNGDKIVSVLDFYNSNGCYFAEQVCVNVPELADIEETDDYILQEYFCSHAFYCLYLVKEKNGSEQLKYYCLFNSGVVYNSDESDPDHGYVAGLSMASLENICNAIAQMS